MRSFLLAAAVSLFHLGGSSSAFCPVPGARRRDAAVAPLRSMSTSAAENAFDAWWAERRRCNTLHNGRTSRSPPAVVTLELGPESVGQVMSEFVGSRYARTACNNAGAQVSPTDHGKVGGMFEYVNVYKEGMVVLKLKQAFDERNEELLGRVSKYLRVKIPQIVEIRAMHRDGRDIY